jgi:hypothetical protein
LPVFLILDDFVIVLLTDVSVGGMIVP